MSTNTPDDRERPVTRREFRIVQLHVAAALVSASLAVICLLILEIKG